MHLTPVKSSEFDERDFLMKCDSVTASPPVLTRSPRCGNLTTQRLPLCPFSLPLPQAFFCLLGTVLAGVIHCSETMNLVNVMVRKVNIPDLIELTAKEAAFVIEYLKDFDPRRAAAASGYPPDSGYKLREKEHIAAAVDRNILKRYEDLPIDAEWVLMQAVDNAMIARQCGNITASNTALMLIAKHVAVDALAKDKLDVSVNTSKEILDRLLRGRRRAAGIDEGDDQGDDEISFL